MTKISASDARAHFAELVGLVGIAKERVVIEKHSRPVAALIPMEELRLLDDLLGAAREDPQFHKRIAALEARRDRTDLIRMFENPHDETVLTPESFADVAHSIKYPRPANQVLRDMMAADD